MQKAHGQWSWWWNGEPTCKLATVSVVILSIFWCMWTFFSSRKQKPPFPPGPTGLPIVGYLPFLGTNLQHTFTKLAHRYGPIYKLWLGKKLCVVVSSPSLAKEMLRDQDIIFANPDPPIAAYIITFGGADIGWCPHGSYWSRMRKLFVREVLSNANLEASYGLRKDEVRKTIGIVYRKLGTAVNIGELIFVTEVNVLMSMLLGGTAEMVNTSEMATDFKEAVAKIMMILGKPNISDFFPALARFDLQGVERQSKDCLQQTDKIIDSIMEERRKMEKARVDAGFDKERKRDFLQSLLDLMDHKTNAFPLDKTQAKAMLLDIMVGGIDTTATMAEWALAEIIDKPLVMKKVQDELAEVVGLNNMVDESHLPKLRYLGAAVKETFRLHPALPLLFPRRPSQSCVLGGYTIPKDTKVFLNIYAIHTDPQCWDNPLEFKPERFMSDTNRWDFFGNNFQYLPFGSGRRICPGIYLAERMLMYLLASLLHLFQWHLPEGEESDLSENFGIVVKKKTPLIATPELRLSNMDLYA